MNFSYLKNTDPEVYKAIAMETKRQNENIELIASENFASSAVVETAGSVLTNKYAEGYPQARWYGGCENVDIVEELAIERAKNIFGAEHVNVQPHCGTVANLAVYLVAVKPGDCVMALDLSCGGHLSHGHPKNFSGMFYKMVHYSVDPVTEQLNYDAILELAKIHKPKLIVTGASAYPRTIDFKKFREICDSVGALLLADIAHIAGLVAAGLHPSPIAYADFVTTTTHKTLRGTRSGIIMCKKQFAKEIDSAVFPGLQGGPLMHIIAAKAVGFKEALKPEFKEYQKQILRNAQILSKEMAKNGFRIVSGGTDNHLMLVDVTSKNVTGKQAQEFLDRAGITVNKNLIPFDKTSPFKTSGIRLGTPAVTTRGMKENEMLLIAGFINKVLSDPSDSVMDSVKKEVVSLTKKFPLYPQMIE